MQTIIKSTFYPLIQCKHKPLMKWSRNLYQCRGELRGMGCSNYSEGKIPLIKLIH